MRLTQDDEGHRQSKSYLRIIGVAENKKPIKKQVAFLTTCLGQQCASRGLFYDLPSYKFTQSDWPYGNYEDGEAALESALGQAMRAYQNKQSN